MHFTILIMRETRAGEKRVSLIPVDVQCLIAAGHAVFIEHQAGVAAGFSDQAYQAVGGQIRYLAANDVSAYQPFFKGIDLIVRAKRPDRDREDLENQAITRGTIMIGALDPLEKPNSHWQAYQQVGIKAYSIDQLTLANDDPMNVLAAMSRLAGKLAVQDAVRLCLQPIQKVVLIGFGVIGQAALKEALLQPLPVTVIASQASQIAQIEQLNARAVLLDRSLTLEQQQGFIKSIISDADIVITSARKAQQQAPLLIPTSTLQAMTAGAVVIDMALSEGGNVEGSEHDTTHVLGNGVLVSNQSGYPKEVPHEASGLWSTASRLVIEQLAQGALSH